MVSGVGEPRLSSLNALSNTGVPGATVARPAWAPARERRQRWLQTLVVTDTAITGIWMIAVFGAFGIELSFSNVSAGIAVFSLWLLMLHVRGTRRTDTLGVGSEEYKRVLGASFVTAGIAAIGALAGQVDIGRELILAGILPATILLLLARWMMRRILHARAANGATLHRVIVVGNSRDITYLARQLAKKSAGMYEIVGLIEDSGTPVSLGDIPVSHTLDELEQLIQIHGADAVMVAGPLASGSETVRTLGWRLEKTKTELILAAGLTDVAGPRIHMCPVEGLPLMHVEPPVFDGALMQTKRLLDILFSLVGLVLCMPLFAVIALAIRLDSAGPVVFAQRRVGKNGKEFTMLKFRTMVVDAELRLKDLQHANDGAGPLFKMKNDPRVTRIGRFLRKLSLDELPQIINVLRGDMSLVGPRPPLQSEVDAYESHTFRRLLIKPGLTGLWQVSGRSDLSWDESVRLDLYYVENWSVVGDLIIMWHTFKAMIRPQGAY